MLRGAEKWRKSENPHQIFAFWKARVRIWVGGEKHDKLRFYWINIEKKNCVKLSWDEQSRKSREINLFWCLIVCNNRINKCQVKKERQKFNSKNIKFVVVEVRKENTEKSHKNSDSLFCQKKRAPPPCERRSLAVERARKKWTWEIKYLPCHSMVARWEMSSLSEQDLFYVASSDLFFHWIFASQKFRSDDESKWKLKYSKFSLVVFQSLWIVATVANVLSSCVHTLKWLWKYESSN